MTFVRVRRIRRKRLPVTRPPPQRPTGRKTEPSIIPHRPRNLSLGGMCHVAHLTEQSESALVRWGCSIDRPDGKIFPQRFRSQVPVGRENLWMASRSQYSLRCQQGKIGKILPARENRNLRLVDSGICAALPNRHYLSDKATIMTLRGKISLLANSPLTSPGKSNMLLIKAE